MFDDLLHVLGWLALFYICWKVLDIAWLFWTLRKTIRRKRSS